MYKHRGISTFGAFISLLIILLSLAKLRARELVIHLVVRDLLYYYYCSEVTCMKLMWLAIKQALMNRGEGYTAITPVTLVDT